MGDAGVAGPAQADGDAISPFACGNPAHEDLPDKKAFEKVVWEKAAAEANVRRLANVLAFHGIAATSRPTPNDRAYAAVKKAVEAGCNPNEVGEMGEWSWWSCPCPDKRHATTDDAYFGGTYIA